MDTQEMRPSLLSGLKKNAWAWILVTIAAIVNWAAFSLEVLPAGAATASRWAALFALGYLTWKRKSLTVWILFSLVLGAEVGFDFPQFADWYNVLSKMFIKLIKTIIAPLLFGTLIVGIAGHADMKQVGRMGLKALIYFEIVTTVALVIGLAAINISKAGVGIPQMDLGGELPEVRKPMTGPEIVLHTFPENFIRSIAEGEILQIVVFCLLFAFAMTMVPYDKRRPFLVFAESLSEIMFKFTGIVMYLAPFGVGGAIAYTVAKMGLSVFQNLLMLLVTLYVALFVFILFVLVPVALIFKVPIRRFWKYASEPVTIAFATTSSEAALPKALENMEKYGVSRKVVSFVLPTGLSFNLDGSTLYLSLAAIFVAQAANIQLSIGEQIAILVTLMLTTKGIAGVSRASLVILLGTAASFGLPEWPIAAILGIDALMDMGRTATNTLGNCLATAIIGKWENEVSFDENPSLTEAPASEG
ncbi:MAG: dicarboxylate/amino acid:cation symporter [Saprospiraceae bacterium]